MLARANAAAAQHHLMDALQTYGPAPGAKKLLDAELAAATNANTTGIYVVWRSTRKNNDCTRVGPLSMCFCGHVYSGHSVNLRKNSYPCTTAGCKCPRYDYCPTRPEEVGEYWLPRRKEFDIRTYSVKCKCTHSHKEHSATFTRNCKLCSCAKYTSNWLCVVCESHGEDHETVWETEDERKSAGRPTGAAFLPFSETPEIAKIVFAPGAGEGKRRNEAGPQRPRIGHDSSAAPSLGPRMSSASTSSGTRRAPSGPARPDDDELSKLTASMSVSSPSSTMSSPGRPPTSSTRPVSRSGIGSGVSRVGSASSTSSRVSSLAGSRIAGQSAAAPKRTAASTSSPTSSRPFGDLAIGGAAIGTADDGKRSGEAGDDYHTETDDVTSGPDAHWEEDTSRIPRLEAITSVEARLPAAELNRYMNPSISHSIPAVRPSPIIRAKSSAKAPSSS